MGTSADLVQWGGQVLNTAAGGQHSSIKIGSGHFSEGHKKAAFIDRCLDLNVQNQVMEWNGMEWKCSISSQRLLKWPSQVANDILRVAKDKQWPGVSFFYGGPGAGGPGCDKRNYILAPSSS